VEGISTGLDKISRSIEIGLGHEVLDLQLWRMHPAVKALQPALPGAAIADARFLVDGRLGLVVSLPGEERQAWTLDPANHDAVDRLGSVAPTAPLAIRPDGQATAFLQTSTTAPDVSLLRPDELAQVWLADLGDDHGHAVWTVDQPDEQLVDLAWAPDSRHLLVIGRQQPSVGMERTSLRWLDTTTGSAQLLALLPSEVVPGSYVWRPDGHALAFLVHTASLSAVCTLSDTGEFHYLGDLGHDGAAGPPVAPVAWGPDGQLVYAALKPTPTAAPNPLGLGSSAPIGLFAAGSNGGPGRSFGAAEGLSPVWWPDGRLLLAGLPTDRGSDLRLREIDTQSEPRELVSIAVATPAATGFGLRWDLPHQRALLVTNRSSFDGGHDYALLDFGWSDPE
jgi:dipeptidyl aminopeptidase/acylaminoacyl peptidase